MKNSFKTLTVILMCIALILPQAVSAQDSSYNAVSARDTGIVIDSDVYTIDNEKGVVCGVEEGTLVQQLTDSIAVTEGITTAVIRVGAELSPETELLSGDIFRTAMVRADGAVGYKDYVIQFVEVMTEGKGPMVTLDDQVSKDTEPGYYEFGSWYTTTKYLCADGKTGARSPNRNDLWASWRPVIEADGDYEIFVWRSTGWKGTCTYTIVHADAQTGETIEDVKVIVYDATETGWQSLGSYYFKKGTEGYVKNAGNGTALKGSDMHFSRAEGLTVSADTDAASYGDGGIYNVDASVLDVTLNFNLIVDEATLVNNLTFMRQDIQLPVDISFVDDDTVRVTGQDEMEPGTRYTLSLPKDITSVNDTPLVRDYIYVFDTNKKGITLQTIVLPVSGDDFVDDISGADALKAVVSAKNPQDTQNLYIVLCVFDDAGRLVSSSEIEKRELVPDAELNVEVTADITADGASYAELYVWDADSYISLCDAEKIMLN